MSLFRRETPGGSSPAFPAGSADSPAAPHRRQVTHIAPGSRVKGEIAGPTELLVEGEIHGEIRVESSVVVGAEGVVQGPISAKVVRVSGRVTGNVHASERVEVAPTGTLEGDIAAPRIVIAEGAFFKGRVEMKEKGAADPRRPQPVVKSRAAQPPPESEERSA
jgi:cytoskeletal protein CcmA (bactofilin family)